MTVLLWGVKQSLIGYVRRMPDGAVELHGGAIETAEGFEFPSVLGEDLRFRGAVVLTGHGGMMHVTIADPALVRAGGGWILEIADPDSPAVRLPFATIESFDGTSASGSALTEEGADLFFGPYEAGTPVDDPRVRH